MNDVDAQSAADETMRLLRECGAILENDHFVHISKLHIGMWINKDAIFPHVDKLERLTRLLARRARGRQIDLVCGPAMGRLVVGEWMAHELGVMCAFAEHDPSPPAGELRGRFMLRRGYDQLVAGRNVLVVDDIVTTGHSIGEVIDAVRDAGGNVVAGASLISVGPRPPESLGLQDYFCLLEYEQPTMWKASQCPLCKRGIPINTRFGHGAEFLAGS